jgi:hypothetical protein
MLQIQTIGLEALLMVRTGDVEVIQKKNQGSKRCEKQAGVDQRCKKYEGTTWTKIKNQVEILSSNLFSR